MRFVMVSRNRSSQPELEMEGVETAAKSDEAAGIMGFPGSEPEAVEVGQQTAARDHIADSPAPGVPGAGGSGR
jgi:hypothetical protein